jgi:hypothetical protein
MESGLQGAPFVTAEAHAPAGELFQRETAIYDDVGAHHE